MATPGTSVLQYFDLAARTIDGAPVIRKLLGTGKVRWYHKIVVRIALPEWAQSNVRSMRVHGTIVRPCNRDSSA